MKQKSVILKRTTQLVFLRQILIFQKQCQHADPTKPKTSPIQMKEPLVVIIQLQPVKSAIPMRVQFSQLQPTNAAAIYLCIMETVHRDTLAQWMSLLKAQNQNGKKPRNLVTFTNQHGERENQIKLCHQSASDFVHFVAIPKL